MRFQGATLDPAAMLANKVLPQLTDRPARRGYKILRTRVLQKLEANQWRSFAVTGPDTGAGKTLTAVNLAIALAQDPNTWVFLVDLDLQRPKVGTTLGMSFSRGLTDYLLGDATFDEVIYHPGIDRLAVVPNSRPIEQSSELLSSQRMHDFMSTARSRGAAPHHRLRCPAAAGVRRRADGRSPDRRRAAGGDTGHHAAQYARTGQGRARGHERPRGRAEPVLRAG